LISRKVTKPQRKITGFRQEKLAETPSFLLFSLPPLLILAFFQESHNIRLTRQSTSNAMPVAIPFSGIRGNLHWTHFK